MLCVPVSHSSTFAAAHGREVIHFSALVARFAASNAVVCLVRSTAVATCCFLHAVGRFRYLAAWAPGFPVEIHGADCVPLTNFFHLEGCALGCTADLICFLEREGCFSQQPLLNLCVANAEHKAIAQNFLWCNRCELTSLREFPQSSLVLIVRLAGLLCALVEAIPFKRDVFSGLAVPLKLLQHWDNFVIVRLVECGEDVSRVFPDDR